MSRPSKNKRPPRVGKDHIIEHLSRKFNIPASAMSMEHTLDVVGWRCGQPEKADTFHIRLKQPIDREKLHHEMQEELKQVFVKPNRLGVPCYFGVIEDKEYTAEQISQTDKSNAPAL